jgi:hypothetical protein
MPDRWQRRLLVLRPGAPNEERRRVVGNSRDAIAVDGAWKQPPAPGERYEVRGSFDPAWVQRVPRAVHEQTLARLWVGKRDASVCRMPGGCRQPAQPLDPFDPKNRRAWPRSVDRAAIEHLATDAHVPALFGFVRGQNADATTYEDPFFAVSAVVMRVDDPAYRDWAVRRLLYQLADQGIAPGQPACVMLSYKPGWHTWYDEEKLGPGPSSCFVPGAHAWEGPAHPCRPRRLGGLLAPTRFGPGVFEAAIDASFSDVFRILAEAGYPDVRVITVERPRFRDRYWSILSDRVRSDPRVSGELGASLVPPLSSLRESPPPAPGAAPRDR